MSLFPRSSAPTEVTRGECWLAAFLLAAGLILRLFYVWHFRIDSDEPQHLHVVWAWANGMLPYRDVFDNHAPVFQALSAPLFHLLGVRADILLPMRAAMLPIFALTIACVWKIGATLFTPRIALWTAVLAAFFPPFFFSSIEFRPDELWTLVWLAVLTVLIGGVATPRRAFAAGLLLGMAFCVSMKTTLLLAALAVALAGALLVRRAAGDPLDWRLLLRCTGAGLAGMAIVPALVVLYFVLHGVGRDLYYCVIQHNVLPGEAHPGKALRSTLRWLLRLSLAAVVVVAVTRLPATLATRTRIAFAFLAASVYYGTLVCFWPIVTAEDFLPFFPAMTITAGAAVLWMGGAIARRIALPAVVFPALCAAAEIAWIVTSQSPFEDQTTDKIGIIADALKLTEPADFVMDSKGETIYHPRPFRYVLEGLTFRRLQRGLITDDIAQRLKDTRTPLATTRRMPKDAREFIKDNYIPIAFRLRVLGKMLREAKQPSEKPCIFDIAVPHRYTIVTPSGLSPGTLDGTPFTGPRELAAGQHEFRPDNVRESVALVWASAIERGYSPFAEIKKDYTTEQD